LAGTICFFGANDIQNNNSSAVADNPGTFRDHLWKPLIDKFYNGAQPIDKACLKIKMGNNIFMAVGAIVTC